MKQKIVSYLKARVRAMSGEDSNRAAAISAMIDADYKLKIGKDVIKPKGELLTLTAEEAMKTYGKPALPLLGAGIEPSVDSLMNTLFGEGNYEATRLEVSWSEGIAQYLTGLAPLLLAAGMVLILSSLRRLVLGFSGLVGGSYWRLSSSGTRRRGCRGMSRPLFFFIGFALVLIDVFFIPGFFVLAIPGALMMLGSLLWGMSDIWPDQPIAWDSGFLMRPLINLITGVGGAIIIFAFLLRFMPRGGLWGGMVLESAIGGETTLAMTDRAEPTLIGATGMAVTALFPSGQIEIGGKRYDARLMLGTVAPGDAVKVTSVGEFELKVEPLEV